MERLHFFSCSESKFSVAKMSRGCNEKYGSQRRACSSSREVDIATTHLAHSASIQKVYVHLKIFFLRSDINDFWVLNVCFLKIGLFFLDFIMIDHFISFLRMQLFFLSMYTLYQLQNKQFLPVKNKQSEPKHFFPAFRQNAAKMKTILIFFRSVSNVSQKS